MNAIDKICEECGKKFKFVWNFPLWTLADILRYNPNLKFMCSVRCANAHLGEDFPYQWIDDKFREFELYKGKIVRTR